MNNDGIGRLDKSERATETSQPQAHVENQPLTYRKYLQVCPVFCPVPNAHLRPACALVLVSGARLIS